LDFELQISDRVLNLQSEIFNLRSRNREGSGRRYVGRMIRFRIVTAFKPSIRLLATDIDGTLLNPQFQISERDLTALQRAHATGIEVVLVTGRRHTFALPIAKQLGFDLWLISSNGAVTRSLAGETFHRDLMPAETCRACAGRCKNSAATPF
jgi:hypothetical protein